MEEHELLEAILEARLDSADDDGAMTVREIAKKSGLSIGRTRLSIADLQNEGKVDVVWTKRSTITTPLTGTMARVPGYVFLRTDV